MYCVGAHSGLTAFGCAPTKRWPSLDSTGFDWTNAPWSTIAQSLFEWVGLRSYERAPLLATVSSGQRNAETALFLCLENCCAISWPGFFLSISPWYDPWLFYWAWSFYCYGRCSQFQYGRLADVAQLPGTLEPSQLPLRTWYHHYFPCFVKTLGFQYWLHKFVW